jgi:hypothetical protein
MSLRSQSSATVTLGQDFQIPVSGATAAIAPPANLATTDAPIARAITQDIFRASTSTCVPALVRPHVRGKFLFAGDEKFYVRGITFPRRRHPSDRP